MPTVISLVLAMSMVCVIFRIKKVEDGTTQIRQQQAMHISIDDVHRIVQEDQSSSLLSTRQMPTMRPKKRPKKRPKRGRRKAEEEAKES